MSDMTAALDAIDRLCNQLAQALQSSAPEILMTFLLIFVLTALLFPPMDDPDQV